MSMPFPVFSLPSERVSVFEPHDILVPRCVCERSPVSDIDGISFSKHCPRAEFKIDNIGAARIDGAAPPARRADRILGKRIWGSFEPAEHMPAEELYHRRELDALTSYEQITRPDAVEKHVASEAAECLGPKLFPFRAANRMPVADLRFDRPTIGKPLVIQ